MKKILIPILVICCVAGLPCCNTPSAGSQASSDGDAHNSRNSLDWQGAYFGTLPCADCPAIHTTIWLEGAEGYRVRRRYAGRSDSAFEENGTFTWNTQGNIIALNDARFFVAENALIPVDEQGNRINRYSLTKSNYAILEKYWRLTELEGKAVAKDSAQRREPHMILKESAGRVVGNGGCNQFSGNFLFEAGNRLTFSQIIRTQMACENMGIEDAFLKALEEVDRFSVSGDTLVLGRGDKAELARFVAVYMD